MLLTIIYQKFSCMNFNFMVIQSKRNPFPFKRSNGKSGSMLPFFNLLV